MMSARPMSSIASSPISSPTRPHSRSRGRDAQSSRLSLQAVLEIANSEISGADPRQIGEETLAVVGVLAENVALRKTLADSSESAEKKQHLLRALFSTRTADAVLRIADAAVGQRWARTQDLVTSLEVAGVTAIAAAAQATGQLGE